MLDMHDHVESIDLDRNCTSLSKYSTGNSVTSLTLVDFPNDESTNKTYLLYVDSFEVVESNCRKTRINYVRKQLEVIRDILWRGDSPLDLKSVVLIISMAGIKMCSLDGKTVHMAHELKRVSYATCDPDFCLFAFVAREPNADHRNRQYCHVFKTDSAEQAEEINYIVGSAFRAAYTEKRRKDNSVEPETENIYNVETAVVDVPADKPRISDEDKTFEISVEQHRQMFSYDERRYSSQEKLETLVVVDDQTQTIDQFPTFDCNAVASSSDVDNVRKYVQLEKIEPVNVSPVRMRPKNTTKVLTKMDENQTQQQRKRRPLSAALMLLGKKEKRKTFTPNSNNASDGCSQDDSNNSTVWSSSSGSDERHLLETVSSTTELLKRNNSAAATGGGSLFKRLFGGSTWRMNSLQGSSGDVGQNNNLKDEKLIGNLKKRRPLSAVFVGAASLRNGVDKKRNSIFNFRSDAPPLAVVRPSSSRQHGGSLKESADRKARSVINLETVARRAADSPARHSIVGPAYRSQQQQQQTVTNFPRSSADSTPNLKRDYLVPLSADDEKKLQDAAWYVERPSKDMIMKVLPYEPFGSFIVRRSTSQQGCLALSVRVPCSHNPNGISHFLILQTNRGFKLKGFSKDFPSVHALVTHHSIMPEQLPCRLVFVNRDTDAFVPTTNLAAYDSHSSDGRRSIGTTMEKSDDDDEIESIYGVTTASAHQHSSPDNLAVL